MDEIRLEARGYVREIVLETAAARSSQVKSETFLYGQMYGKTRPRRVIASFHWSLVR